MTAEPYRRLCQKEALAVVSSRYTEKSQGETNLSMCTGAGKTFVIVDVCHLPGVNRTILVFPSLLLIQQFYRDHKASFPHMFYCATEDTLHDVPRISASFAELGFDSFTILTTYVSAPLLLAALSDERRLDMLIADEAHHITAPVYSAAYATAAPFIGHTVHFSATLPDAKEPHYKYPLLKGIRDGVIRDFNIELFISKSGEDTGLIQMIDKLVALHDRKAKILIYTAEANTDGSSVRTFMMRNATALRARGWWIEGINADIEDKDREPLLRAFEADKSSASILVSCRTLSEGIDLKNANCMLPWDPSASVKDNIQRIGRVVRLYKNAGGAVAKDQPPSTILIPVFVEEAEYAACSGDRAAIHTLLEKQISEGEKGNFRPIVNVCTALKSELAEEDSDLFNQLLNYPFTPRVRVDKDLVTCVAAQLKKSIEDVLEEMATTLTEKGELEEETIDAIREGDLEQEDAGAIITALAESQEIRLIIRDKDEEEVIGKGSKEIIVERKGSFYTASKKKKSDAAARKRVAHRLRTSFSDGCQILLGLEAVDLDATEGLVLARLTAEVQYDEDWEKRRVEWAAMYEKLGKTPTANSKDLEEKRAGSWKHHQRNAYKNKSLCMTPERITALESTNGWTWDKEDDWELNRQYWLTIYKKLGNKIPSHESKDLGEKRIGAWQHYQRNAYKKQKLTIDKIKRLEDTDGWIWESEDPWEPNRLHWIAQYQKLANPSTAHSKNAEKERARIWQNKQRQDYKQKKTCMTVERIAALNATPGWKWEEEDSWEPNRLHWLSQYQKLGKKPSEDSKDSDEKKAGQWQSTQRQDYKNKIMIADRIAALNATPGWFWKSEDTWEPNRIHWLSQFQKLGRTPSAMSKDSHEKKAGQWQHNQRDAYKKKNIIPKRIAALNATPGWSWSADAPPVTPALTDGDVIEHITDHVPERKRHIPTGEAAASTRTPQERERSHLELLHQAYKTRNADTYFSFMQKDPAKFEEYHAVADAHDARDPPERKPQNKVADMLTKNNRASYKAIDLGCGRNALRIDERVSKMAWTSVDVVAADSTVTVADMGALPFEDESFDIAVLNRSLWARNHDAVLREVWRILKDGGRAILCESFQRWFSDGENTLLTAVKAAGFTVKSEYGTSSDITVSDVFQYIEVLKM
jgi:superfamily II DNA or RNA helicase